MYQRAGGGVQHVHDGQGDRQKVDAHGQADAELDGFDGGIGKALQIGQFGNIITHQHDIGSVYSNIAAQAAHGDAHVGGFQGGRVVDAVTDHTDALALLPDGGNAADFLLRQQLRTHLLDANLLRKVIGRLFVVTGEQNDVGVHTVQPLHHALGFGPQHLYHLKAHRSELKGILGCDSGALFMRYFKEYLRDLFGRYMDDFSVSVPSDYLLNHLVGSFAETVTWWITGKTAYTPEEVAGFFIAVIKAS